MKKGKIFYGYWILSATSIIGLFTQLGSMSSFGVFVKPLESTFGWDRTIIMGGFTSMVCLIGLSSPFIGRLLDRKGAKKVMIPLVLTQVIGLIILSQMTHPLEYFLGYCIIGIGCTATGPMGASFLVTHWFKKRRGLALGISSVGIALSGVVFLPLVAVSLIPGFGWRTTYLSMAAVIVVTAIPLLLFIVKTKPADIGLFPDGIIETNDMPETEKKPMLALKAISLKAALTTLAFWLIAFSLIFNHTHLGIMQSIFPYLTDQGFSVGLVSIVNSFLFIVICISMFLFGMLSDLIAPKFAAALGLACMAIGVFLLIMVNPSSSFPLFMIIAIGLGLGVGSWMPSMSLLISTTFGSASYGFIFGLLSIFIYAGGAIGPLIAGYSFDIQNSYRLGFIIILILIAAAIPLVLAVPRKTSRVTS